MRRVVYLNLTDYSLYETYVDNLIPVLKGYKVVEHD